MSPHQFRHTVATEMIDAGVDIYAVKNFLGHSSVIMTEKYIKVYQQRLKKEFKDKLLNLMLQQLKIISQSKKKFSVITNGSKTKLSPFSTKVTDVVSILIKCLPVLTR
ncbi:tyrosine-type recombinase/integrase [Bacillus paranthracis]